MQFIHSQLENRCKKTTTMELINCCRLKFNPSRPIYTIPKKNCYKAFRYVCTKQFAASCTIHSTSWDGPLGISYQEKSLIQLSRYWAFQAKLQSRPKRYKDDHEKSELFDNPLHINSIKYTYFETFKKRIYDLSIFQYFLLGWDINSASIRVFFIYFSGRERELNLTPSALLAKGKLALS